MAEVTMPMSIQEAINKAINGDVKFSVVSDKDSEISQGIDYEYATMTIDGEVEKKVSKVTETFETYKIETSFIYDTEGNLINMTDTKVLL